MARTPRDIEAILAERKKKTALENIGQVADAVMLHYVMDTLYQHCLSKGHGLRADWKPNLELSGKKYMSKLPPEQVKLINLAVTRAAQEVFGPVLGSMVGIDPRHAIIAFAQVVLKLCDQHRYVFTDDALVLQSLGIRNEAVEEGTEDWNYYPSQVKWLYDEFMKRVDASDYFKDENEHEGIALEVLK